MITASVQGRHDLVEMINPPGAKDEVNNRRLQRFGTEGALMMDFHDIATSNPNQPR